MRDTHPPSSQGSQRQKILKSFVNTQGLATFMRVTSVFFVFPKYFTFIVLKIIFNHPRCPETSLPWSRLQAQTSRGALYWFALIPEPSGTRPSSACSCLQRGGSETGSTCPGASFSADRPTWPPTHRSPALKCRAQGMQPQP